MAGFRDYSVTLAAGAELSLSVPDSNVVSCISAAAAFTISPDSRTPVELQQGVGITFEEKFDSLRILNKSASTQTIKVYVGSGEIRDNRFVVSGGLSFAGSAVSTLNNHTVTNAATMVKAQKTSRVSILLVNTGAAICYVGLANTVTAANGLPIGAGSSLLLTVQSAIYVISGGTNTELRVLEESVS